MEEMQDLLLWQQSLDAILQDCVLFPNIQLDVWGSND